MSVTAEDLITPTCYVRHKEYSIIVEEGEYNERNDDLYLIIRLLD